MTIRTRFILGALAIATVALANSVLAQTSPAFTPEEREAVYSASIVKRATAILEPLKLTDLARSNIVHGNVVAFYRALRARDAAVDTMLASVSKDIPGAETNRIAMVRILSKPLHEQFFKRLAGDLSPSQVELVKDKMTYDKVKVTYDAYCQIVPGLNDTEKAKILEELKQAREEAVDGGSADEKSAIFQLHKDKINEFLNAHGHNIAQATKEWEAKQPAANSSAAK